MRMLIAILLILSPAVHATTSDHYETLDALYAEATLVVQGTVQHRFQAHQIEPVYKQRPSTPKRRPLMTPYAIRIAKIFKGDWNEGRVQGRVQGRVRVMQAGGETDTYSQIIDGAPLMEEGQEVVLFLEPHINGKGEDTGRFVILGMDDGIFLVEGEDLAKMPDSDNGVYVIDTLPMDDLLILSD